MKNREVSEILSRIGILLEINDENAFKVRAYYRAADTIKSLPEDIENVKNEKRLCAIPGIGKELEAKITEFLETGKMAFYQKLIKKVPESLLDIVNIPSVGPKKAKLFFEKLKVKNVEDLRKAAEKGKLLELPGIKEKTIENIINGMNIVKQGQSRMTAALAARVVDEFVGSLGKLKEVKKISTAGSFRRGRETIGDIDILVNSANPDKVMEVFVRMPQVKQVDNHGATKSSVITKDNVQVDLRVVEPKSYGAALLYFTGSKSFNVKLRQIAIKKKMKVNEYGIFSTRGKSEKYLAGRTEEECFKALGLDYVPPELREDIGESNLFRGTLPDLIELKDIKGELHVHSTWSDGKNSIQEMARAAKRLGYQYLAISDHSFKLRVANGVSPADLKKKKREIDQLNSQDKNFRILYGTEIEIDGEGNLDYNSKILSEFDVVIASVHSGFEQTRQKLTKRLVKACRNKYVTAIAHPTGVHIGKRDPYDIDFKEVCRAAADHNTFLEINSFPIRMDLNSSNVYFAKAEGVKFIISTDSHSVNHLDYMKFGISVARRGWLEKKDVLNTLTLKQLEKAIKK